MRTRRPIAVLSVLLLSLTGCSASADRTGGSVAFLAADSSLAYVQEMTLGFAAGVDLVGGVAHTEAGPAVGDTTQQLTMFQRLRTQHTGGVSVFTLSPELLADSLAAAGQAGTPVIAVHSPPPDGSGVGLYVGNDDVELGRMLADQVAERLPVWTDGVAVLGASVPGTLALEKRIAGLRAELKLRMPGLRLLGPFDTKEDPAANREAWQVLERANPGARAFIGVGDDDAASLAAVRAQSGGSWLAAGFGLDGRALRAVQSGDLLLVSPETFVQGAIAGWLQAGHTRTGRALPQGWIVVPGLAVTGANVSQILARQMSAANRATSTRATIQEILTDTGTYLRPLAGAG